MNTEIPLQREAEAQRRPLTDEGRSIFSRDQLTRIRNKLSEHKIMNSSSERRRVANNLWRILNELENRTPPIKRLEVCRRAGKIFHEGDSTKRLYNFAIKPALPEKEQLNRAKGITKKIRRYVELAEVAAELSGKDKDHYIPALVEGTRYSLLPSEGKWDPDEVSTRAWNDIVSMLTLASESISTTYKLQDLLRQITEAGIGVGGRGSWRGGNIERYQIGQVMPRPALVSQLDLVPCPSIYLGNIVAASHIPCELHFGLIKIDEHEKALEAVYRKLVDAGLESNSMKAHAVAELRVYLVLLPHGESGEVKPVLRLSPYTEFFADEDFYGFSNVKSRSSKVTAPDPVKRGDRVGECWGSLSGDYLIENAYGSLEFAAWHEETHWCVDLWMNAEFDSEFADTYAKSVHSKIPEGGSLLVSLDEHAWKYLDYELGRNFGSWRGIQKKRFCYEVQVFLNTAKIMIDADSVPTNFKKDTMLAALDRSLDSALDQGRLDRLLKADAEKFVVEAMAALAKFSEEQKAEDKRLRTNLDRSCKRREAFASEYRSGRE
jgi:hypothetical protein